MKDRLIRFIILIAIIALIGLSAVVIYKLSEFQSIEWQSRATIAQMQPEIEIAESQAAINRAVAFSLYTDNGIKVMAIVAPYGLIGLYLIIKVGASVYERIQRIIHNTNNTTIITTD